MLPLRTDVITRARYAQGGGIQRIIPVAVARPRTSAELEQAVEWAIAHDVSITPRGAGSAMSGSAVGEGLVLDLTALGRASGPLDLSPHSTHVYVPGSMTLGQLAAVAAPVGLRLGPDPSSAGWATVSGAISTNAAGARSYQLGAMDRWVDAVDLFTVDGPLTLTRDQPPDPMHPVVQRFVRDALPLLTRHHNAVMARWPRTRKNSLGYALDRFWQSGALLDLVIGSEGTLGIITGARVRLERIPPHRAAMRVALARRGDLAACVDALTESEPTTMELLDRSLLQLVARWMPETESSDLWNAAAALLLVDLEAESASDLSRRIDLAMRRVADLAIDVRTAREPADMAALWAVRHHASPALSALTDGRRSLQVIEDACVPPASLADYLDLVDRACAEQSVDAVIFGHAGDGHVHVNLLPDPAQPSWLSRVRAIYHQVSLGVRALDGTLAGEHGAGRLRAGLLGQHLGAEALACFEAVKRAFDPEARFNRGVIIPDGRDPFDRLKVGAMAVPLPAGLDAALQRIEQERRWGESRWEAHTGKW